MSAATLAWWSNDTKAVEKYTATGQFELVSCLGNITSNAEGPRIHAHAILTAPGGLVAGHAVALTVRASVKAAAIVLLLVSIFKEDGMRPGVAVPLAMMFLVTAIIALAGGRHGGNSGDSGQ